MSNNSLDLSKEKKLGKNTLLFFIGSFGSKILSYFLIPFFTLYLTTEEYGISDTIFTTVSLAYPILSLAIYEAVFRFLLDKKDEKQAFTIGLIISFISCIIISIGALFFVSNPTFSDYYLYFVLYYVFIVFANLLSNFAKGIGKNGLLAISGILSTLVLVASCLIFIKYLTLGIFGYLLAYIISNVFVCAFLLVSCRAYRYISRPSNISKQLLLNMLKYALPIIPNAISWWLSTSSDRYIINWMCGYSYTGVYSMGYKIPTLITMVTSVFLTAWQISSVDDFGSEKSKVFFEKVYSLFLALTSILVAFIILLTRELAFVLFKNDFFEAWIYVPILCFAYLFHDLSSFYGSIYIASKRTKMMFVSTFVGALVNFVLNIVLIYYFGPYGAAIATLVGYFMVWVLRTITCRKMLPFKVNHYKEAIIFGLLLLDLIVYTLHLPLFRIYSVVFFVLIVVLNYKQLVGLFRTTIGFFKKKNT